MAETVHARWIQWLVDHGLSKAEIARQAVCSAAAVTRWSKGMRGPSEHYRTDLIAVINKALRANGYRLIDVPAYYAGPERIEKR